MEFRSKSGSDYKRGEQMNIIETSNEALIIKGNILVIKIEPKEDKIIWTFPSKEAADIGEKVFNRSGFKYMKRR